MKENCEFHCFKESGKWYASARGVLTKEVYEVFGGAERKAQIIKDNGGTWPGLSSEGEEFFCIAINDDAFGYPLMFHPKKELHTNEEILKFLLTTEDKLNGIAGTLLTRILAALDDIKTNGDENRQSLLYRITRILDPSV